MTTVVEVVLILAFVLGAGAHDGWLEGGKIRGQNHQWEVTWVDQAVGRGGGTRKKDHSETYIVSGVWLENVIS